MIKEAHNFIKTHFNDIILFIIVALLVMLAFAIGFITAKYQFKEPIQIINNGKSFANYSNYKCHKCGSHNNCAILHSRSSKGAFCCDFIN